MTIGGTAGHLVNASSTSTMSYECYWFCNKGGQEYGEGVCDTAWSPLPGTCDEGVEDDTATCTYTGNCNFEEPIEDPVDDPPLVP